LRFGSDYEVIKLDILANAKTHHLVFKHDYKNVEPNNSQSVSLYFHLIPPCV